jgi:hypothetical protein
VFCEGESAAEVMPAITAMQAAAASERITTVGTANVPVSVQPTALMD